jgi:hypothetical protein
LLVLGSVLWAVSSRVALIALTSWFSITAGQSVLAPFGAIATIVQGPGALAAGTATVWVGMAVHSVLSALFGVGFAVLTQPVRANNAMLAMAGLLYGGALYAINIEILARFVPQFSVLFMTNHPFELAIHFFFGALLALFFLNPRGSTPNVGP